MSKMSSQLPKQLWRDITKGRGDYILINSYCWSLITTFISNINNTVKRTPNLPVIGHLPYGDTLEEEWYRLIPRQLFLGGSTLLLNCLIDAIHFRCKT